MSLDGVSVLECDLDTLLASLRHQPQLRKRQSEPSAARKWGRVKSTVTVATALGGNMQQVAHARPSAPPAYNRAGRVPPPPAKSPPHYAPSPGSSARLPLSLAA